MVAYLLGNQLSRSQVLTFTGLFVFFAMFATLGAGRSFEIGYHLAITYGDGLVPANIGLVARVLMLMGIIASLKFMRDIRQSKT